MREVPFEHVDVRQRADGFGRSDEVDRQRTVLEARWPNTSAGRGFRGGYRNALHTAIGVGDAAHDSVRVQREDRLAGLGAEFVQELVAAEQFGFPSAFYFGRREHDLAVRVTDCS